MHEERGAFHDHFRREVLASSRDRAWAGVTVDLLRVPGEVAGVIPSCENHTVSVLTNGFCEAAATLGGTDVRGKLTSGSIAVVPAGITSTFEGDSENEVALISVSPHFLIEAAVAVGAEHTIRGDIPIAFNARDEFIETTCKLLLLELDKPKHPLQRLIYDTTSRWRCSGRLTGRHA